ncbi:hypothetical protein AVEN_130928-1 [Araneus ventricosus]|uniref:DDE-1 domain-containing protein n=1 Tax=Araneus ventricosus TaxID=182803 RepID=A0A4Y2FM63_ARAVE|nr:hypothetical protein AVEN_130928-1 [Araneus ventricosus]
MNDDWNNERLDSRLEQKNEEASKKNASLPGQCYFSSRWFKIKKRKISSCESGEELAKSVSVLDAVSWITSSALKKVESGSVLKCFKKAGFASASDVVPDSTTDENEKELNELLTHMDSNVRVEDYVEIVKDLWIEEGELNVTNFIPQNTTEQFALSHDDGNDFL